jgi:hypothetical protein
MGFCDHDNEPLCDRVNDTDECLLPDSTIVVY